MPAYELRLRAVKKLTPLLPLLLPIFKKQIIQVYSRPHYWVNQEKAHFPSKRAKFTVWSKERMDGEKTCFYKHHYETRFEP